MIARDTKGILNYTPENCIFAYDELCKVNNELVEGMRLDSDADVNHLGAMNRMIQDYLIIRVGGLFDKTEHKAKGRVDEIVSFAEIKEIKGKIKGSDPFFCYGK